VKETAKILLVDDLPANLQALAKIIEQEDRQIFQATSGEAALALLLKHEFALAILDVMMPGMSGFELAELMRSTKRTCQIPIVFVSAVGRETQFAFKGYESGAVDFLYKPLDIAAVKSKVNVFVSLYQQRQEVKHQVTNLEKMHVELNATKVQLERALQMRDEFISMVAHELRTPLNTLHLETQLRRMMLARGDMTAFGPEQLDAMLTRDSRQIESMTRLIEDMVDVSRIQNGKLSIQPAACNLSDLLRRILENLAQHAQLAGCQLNSRIEDGIKGVWDCFRLEQVIINLLTNAFRYGAGKPVEVALVARSDCAELTVKDNGVGIASADHERIFQRFERLSTEVREGLGMGLYIARELAEAQGGTLQVESKLGEGALFILRMYR